uniref:Uncharacterized protein n=1 Tax=Populus trichocarpa TaxID=3694 RepID=B9HPG7_POPTR
MDISNVIEQVSISYFLDALGRLAQWARTKISDYTWVDSIADRESKTKYHSRSKARVARPRHIMSAYHEESFEPHSRTVQKEEEICARQGCRDPKVYLLRRKMDKRRNRATRFYSHLLVSITNGLIDYVPAEEVDYDPDEGEDQT